MKAKFHMKFFNTKSPEAWKNDWNSELFGLLIELFSLFFEFWTFWCFRIRKILEGDASRLWLADLDFFSGYSFDNSLKGANYRYFSENHSILLRFNPGTGWRLHLDLVWKLEKLRVFPIKNSFSCGAFLFFVGSVLLLHEVIISVIRSTSSAITQNASKTMRNISISSVILQCNLLMIIIDNKHNSKPLKWLIFLKIIIPLTVTRIFRKDYILKNS